MCDGLKLKIKCDDDHDDDRYFLVDDDDDSCKNYSCGNINTLNYYFYSSILK